MNCSWDSEVIVVEMAKGICIHVVTYSSVLTVLIKRSARLFPVGCSTADILTRVVGVVGQYRRAWLIANPGWNGGCQAPDGEPGPSARR